MTSSPPQPDAVRPLAGRLRRLVLKELREILRDRRTIITLVVMPILIYPLLAVVFQRFLVTSVSTEHNVEYWIGVESESAGTRLKEQLETGQAILKDTSPDTFAPPQTAASALGKNAEAEPPKPPVFVLVVMPTEDARRYVVDSSFHLVVVQERHRGESAQGLKTPSTWQLVYRAGSPSSEAALHYVEACLSAYNERHLNEQLTELGVTATQPAATVRRAIHFSGTPLFSLAALVPLILVLMTVTGAVYPAIDLTAGERERGTLETLIAAPVPRLGLLMAKYVAVLTVALLTAVVNLLGMTITAHSTGLASTLFGAGMTFGTIVKVLLLLGLFAAFFSAILLALTSYARSFKEAQAYIIPLMLICLVPGVICLLPGLEFKGWMAVTPLVNIVMLARDLLENRVDPALAAVAVCSTLFYVAAAITLAARIFGTDAILYGSPATWSDLVRRPHEPRKLVTLPAAMLGLALMFPAYFVLSNGLALSPELPMNRRLMVIALITAIVFGGIPIALTAFGRVKWTSGLALRWPSAGSLIGAVLMGVSLWPIAHEVFLASNWMGLSVLGDEQREQVEQMLRQMQDVPLPLILFAMALVPAFFEELCFRGFLFGALRTKLAEDRTVIASALLFGIFHEVLFPGRFLASTFLGLVLGWVRLRTRSIVPCIVLHATHNGLLLTLARYRDELATRGWDVEEQTHLPLLWLAGAVLGIVLAIAVIVLTKPRPTARVAANVTS
jgi:ABC-2 type transport system permease protein/sodium transport system permease protein